MKKKIGIILLILIILGGLNIGYDYYYFHDLATNYNSIAYKSDTEQYKTYTYSLNVSSIGNFKIVDVGAGNPIMKGHLFKIPFTNKCIINCLFDSDFDPNFLNIKHRIKIISLNAMGLSDSDYTPFVALIFINDGEQLQFNSVH